MAETHSTQLKKRSTVDAWLVKSNEQILGPFDSNIVTQKLLARDIVIIDEICHPEGRWRLIRDEPAFSDVVEETRKQLMNAREETEVDGYTSTQIGAQTITGASVSDSAKDFSEITNPEALGQELTPPSMLRGHNHIGSTRTVDAMEPANVSSEHDYSGADAHAKQSDYKQFGVRDKSLAPASAAMWIVAALVVIGALYLVLTAKKSSPDRVVASLDYNHSLKTADLAWQIGDFATAEKLYGQANRTKPLQSEVISHLAPLMIQIDGQTVEAKRLIEDTERAVREGEESTSALDQDLRLALGLASLFSAEFKEARDIFSGLADHKSLSRIQKQVLEFNFGVLDFSQANYDSAADHFEKAGAEPITVFLRARSLILDTKKKGGHKDAFRLLNELSKTSFDYQQEAQLLSAYLLMEIGNKKAATGRAQITLETDPELTGAHWHNPFLYQAPATWKDLVSICRDLSNGLQENVSRALLALCLSKAGQSEEATRVLNDALAADGEDQLLQAVNAQLLYNSNRDDEAGAALQIASRKEPVPALARLVKARLCARHGETSCAQEEWKAVANTRVNSLAANIGLAKLALGRGESDEARDLAKKALGLSSLYRPAMRLEIEGYDVVPKNLNPQPSGTAK